MDSKAREKTNKSYSTDSSLGATHGEWEVL
jgi:hypothetical protein